MSNIKLTRRQLSYYASLCAIQSLLNPVTSSYADDSVKFIDYPFKLGVASGDPSTEGFVLWSRLAPNPYDLSAMTAQSIPVHWQVAEDEKMKKIVQSGTALAHAEHAHSLHVEVFGLKPDREYFYRFIANKESSPIGRTRTLPLIGSQLKSFRFAFASCQDITGGYYAAYRDMIEQDPQLIIHTGDYIYESVYRNGGRQIPVIESMSLADYRHLHARYKMDRDLQAAHAAAPWLVIWDDHEVENDWGGDYSQRTAAPELFLQRKMAAIKAYYEHMPLRLSAALQRGHAHLYQRKVIGDLIEFNLLDCRQYRSQPPCKEKNGHPPRHIELCDEAIATERSLLGKPQEQWLRRSFGHAEAKWSSIVQTTNMGPFDYLKGEERKYRSDGWDAYAATRQRILDLIVEKSITNAVAIGGDIHTFYAGVVNANAFDFDSPAVLSELVTTSITSDGGGDSRYNTATSLFSENPFARYFENRRRGYTLCEVNHQHWLAKLRGVENVQDPDSPVTTIKELVIENGLVDVLTG